MGGGEVLVTRARHWHDRERHLAFLTALRDGDPQAAVCHLAVDLGATGVTLADLEPIGLDTAAAAGVLAAAVRGGELEVLETGGVSAGGLRRRWFAGGTRAALRAALLALAGERSAARPERPFSSAAELAAAVPALPLEEADALLRELADEGRLVAGGGGYAPAGAGVLDDVQEALAGRLLRLLSAEPFAPPTLATLSEQTGASARDVARVLEALARREEVVRADKDLWFIAGAAAEAREQLLGALARDGQVTLAGFRDQLGCGRRNAQALLELFDREGLTLRRGDVRVPRRRR